MTRIISFILCILILFPMSVDAQRKKRRKTSRARTTNIGTINSISQTDIPGLLKIKIDDAEYALCQEVKCGRIRKAALPVGKEAELLKEGSKVQFTHRSARSGDFKFYIRDLLASDKVSGTIKKCKKGKRGRASYISTYVPMSNGRKKRFKLLLTDDTNFKTESCKIGETVNASGKVIARGKFQTETYNFGNNQPVPPTTAPTPINDDIKPGVLPELPKRPPTAKKGDPEIPKTFSGAKIFRAIMNKQEGCDVDTNAYGEARLILWEKEKIAIIEYVFRDLSSDFASSHVHFAEDGSIYVDLNVNVSQAGNYVTWEINDNLIFTPEEQIQLLYDGKFYINVHSDKCIKGEIKGTFNPKTPPNMDPPKVDPPKITPPNVEPPKINPPKTNPPKTDPPKIEPPTVQPPMMDPPTMNPPKTEPPKDDIPVKVKDIANNQTNISRLLNQATFGATPDLINTITNSSPTAFLTSQLNIANGQKCLLLPKVQKLRAQKKNATSMELFQEAWWDCTLNSPEDEVCHRVAFALSQQWVVSGKRTDLNFEEALAVFYDILKVNCFGNIRNLMTEVTFSTPMGRYLDMKNLTENAFNENYARELLQLFTIGVAELNSDGSVLMKGGKPIATYTQEDVTNLSKAFSGWTWSSKDFYGDSGDWTQNMAFVLDEHVKGDKKFIDLNIPGNLTQVEQINLALDYIFSHKNICPFTSKNLIKQLITSNPTGTYIQRVANVCEKDENGIRGNLRAMINAILTDTEARDLSKVDKSSYGKLRQPTMILAHLLKIGKAGGQNIPKGCIIKRLDQDLRQSPLYAPSVFNFFEPSYSTSYGNVSKANLTSPEFKLLNQTSIVDNLNLFTELTGSRKLSCSGTNLNVNFSDLESKNKDDLFKVVDLILTGGELGSSSKFKDLIYKYVGNEKDPKKLVSRTFKAALSSQKFIIRK